ncbi:hypothetical protein RSJ42_08160 [Methanosarcina hadiensis]|uniref:hypothetical protein n=1 Tax=Methanosarcina hadiensis TaxID=3078083 RepID=UPI0039779DA9
MVLDSIFAIIYDQLNRALNAEMKESERVELVKSTVKEALLGCCYDWKTRSKWASYKVTDDMLRGYARMLIGVSVKFRANDMLSESICEDILGYATRMRNVADEPKHQDSEIGYVKETGEIFVGLDRMYKNFDRLFEDSIIE